MGEAGALRYDAREAEAKEPRRLSSIDVKRELRGIALALVLVAAATAISYVLSTLSTCGAAR